MFGYKMINIYWVMRRNMKKTNLNCVCFTISHCQNNHLLSVHKCHTMCIYNKLKCWLLHSPEKKLSFLMYMYFQWLLKGFKECNFLKSSWIFHICWSKFSGSLIFKISFIKVVFMKLINIYIQPWVRKNPATFANIKTHHTHTLENI